MKVVRRLRAIGPRPVLLARYTAHHVTSRQHARRLRQTYGTRVATVPDGASLALPSIDVSPYDELPPPLRPDADRIREEAEAAVRHELDLLGSGPVALGSTIDWQADFKSGYRWPPAFYLDVEVTRLTDASDAKVPWELSRGHHLLTLARAARLFQDDRFAVELEEQFDSWIEANPAGQGINWVNAMEVAIRAVNWVWALAILEPSRRLRDSTRARVTTSLQQHGRHIAANLEGSPWLRSNHYLADVLGLVVLGAVVVDDPDARGWFEAGRTAFDRQIRAQVHDDGLAFEASLPYHALVLEMFLLARFVCASSGRPLSGSYDERLRRMLAATRVVRHPNGRLPQTGDSDSGRILPGGVGRPATADPLLSLGPAILGDDRLLDGDPDPEVAWTLGVAAWSNLRARPHAPVTQERAFPAGGIYVLARDDVHVVVRCGDVGQNGNGGHAHNDALSFELSAGGRPFVVDSGTYAYTSDVEQRNAFRATAAHNTVLVAESEIHPIAEERLFELAQFARIRVESFEQGEGDVRLVGSHDGYRRLDPPVLHRRTFHLDHAGVLEVRDELQGTGAHVARSFVHLAPGVEVVPLADDRFELELGSERLMLSVVGADDVEVQEGWISSGFGVREQAPVVVAQLRGPLPLSVDMRFERSGR